MVKNQNGKDREVAVARIEWKATPEITVSEVLFFVVFFGHLRCDNHSQEGTKYTGSHHSTLGMGILHGRIRRSQAVASAHISRADYSITPKAYWLSYLPV